MEIVIINVVVSILNMNSERKQRKKTEIHFGLTVIVWEKIEKISA